jgi:hypothetical protein
LQELPEDIPLWLLKSHKHINALIAFAGCFVFGYALSYYQINASDKGIVNNLRTIISYNNWQDYQRILSIKNDKKRKEISLPSGNCT